MTISYGTSPPKVEVLFFKGCVKEPTFKCRRFLMRLMLAFPHWLLQISHCFWFYSLLFINFLLDERFLHNKLCYATATFQKLYIHIAYCIIHPSSSFAISYAFLLLCFISVFHFCFSSLLQFELDILRFAHFFFLESVWFRQICLFSGFQNFQWWGYSA